MHAYSPEQELAKLRKEVQISKAALEASQAAAKKADADLAAASAAAEAGTAGKTAAEKVCSICCIVASMRGLGVVLVGSIEGGVSLTQAWRTSASLS